MSKIKKQIRFDSPQSPEEGNKIKNNINGNKEKKDMNLVEIRRLINKNNMRFNKKDEHVKDLHNIQKTRNELREKLKQLKINDKGKLTFQPKFNKKSQILMRKVKNPQIERSENWLKTKNEKIDIKKKIKEVLILKQENKEAKKKLYKNRIKGVSKVKKQIDKPRLNITKSFIPQKKKLFKNKGFDYNFSNNDNNGYEGEVEDKFAKTDKIFKEKVDDKYMNIKDFNKTMKKRRDDEDFWKP